MGTTADLTKKGPEFDTNNDNIVIVHNLETIAGGRTLDVTEYTPDVIPAGHPIIMDEATEKIFKPFPVSDGALGTLPVGYKYVGINISTIKKELPFSGIMVRGAVNKNATFYPMDSILSAIRTALPLIRFTQD